MDFYVTKMRMALLPIVAIGLMAQQAAGPAKFEVVSIKPATPESRGASGCFPDASNG